MADRIERMPSDKTDAARAATPIYVEKTKLPGVVAFGEAMLRKKPSGMRIAAMGAPRRAIQMDHAGPEIDPASNWQTSERMTRTPA
jgi:hypothetical protein